MPTDPVALTADLIRCQSVTPQEGGALVLLERILTDAGFTCTRVDRGATANLFARWGVRGAARSFGFNGHTDVVPPGDPALWSADPFGAGIRDGWMIGRGAADMKSGVAAFVAAAVDFVRTTPPPADGAILLAITGDEEGAATDGTTAILDWMAAEGEAMSVCLVGEPTCPEHLGDTMKIGRRGSLNAHFTVTGVQGHSAYPERARNPLSALARLVERLSVPLDGGSAHFGPSTLAFVTIDTGNPATNVIPARVQATANVRFNDLHDGAAITALLRREADRIEAETGVTVALRVQVSGESFLTPPGPLSDLVAGAVQAVTGQVPALSTSGGTSDARFVREHCPVVEFGLVGTTMHQIDERVEVAQIAALKAIYARCLHDYFA